MIVYTSLLNRGVCLSPSLIIIPNWAKGDSAYLIHEQVHSGQQQRDGVITFWWRYLTNKSWRLSYEVEAYHAQYKAAPQGIWDYARWLSSGYNLDISEVAARDVIVSGVP